MTRDEAERILAGIWSEVLGVEVRPEDDVFDLGGYSLLVVEVLAKARTAGLDPTAADVFEHPTAAGLADALIGQPGVVSRVWRASISPRDPAAPRCLVPLSPDGDREPVVCVHTGTGHVRLFTALAERTRNGRPAYGLEAVGYRAAVRPFLSIGETAERYLDELRQLQPTGPYHLAGQCSGSVIALEMATRLGSEVGSLVLIDVPSGMPELDPGWGLTDHADYLSGVLRDRFGLVDPVADLPGVLAELKRRRWFDPDDRIEDFDRLLVCWAAAQYAQEHYEPRRYDKDVHLITPLPETTRRYWEPFLPQAEIHPVEETTLMRIITARPVIDLFDKVLR